MKTMTLASVVVEIRRGCDGMYFDAGELDALVDARRGDPSHGGEGKPRATWAA
jgi:Zn-finger nucleic acid-binding protein